MSFITNVDATGTSYKGTIHTKYSTLVAKFGPAGEGTSDGKTQAEWAIRFENGVVATIYDWKQYDTPVEQVTEWNIGGYDNRALTYVRKILG